MSRFRRPSPQTTGVLSALAETAPDWSHGYELTKQLGLKAGTMYPILIRLAERGLVESRWETDAPAGRPARHLYRLSAEGAELLDGLRPSAAAMDAATSRRARTVPLDTGGALA